MAGREPGQGYLLKMSQIVLGYILLGLGGHGEELKLYFKFIRKILKEVGEERDLVFILERSLCSDFILNQNYPYDKTLSRGSDNSSTEMDQEEGTGLLNFSFLSFLGFFLWQILGINQYPFLLYYCYQNSDFIRWQCMPTAQPHLQVALGGW